MNRERLISVAAGAEPADLLIRNARVVDVFTGEVREGNIAVCEGRIAGVGDYTDALSSIELNGKYVAPTYMDAHIHLESTMLTPAEFAKVVLPKGTTSSVSDPHEIANVLGLSGIELMLKLSEGLPFDFFFTLSSCVPATHLETSGAQLSAKELEGLANKARIVGLAEMMNFPGVINRSSDVMAKLELAHRNNMLIDGHSPLLSGRSLNAYLCGGISSDHECTRLEEAREKLSKGMWIFIRQGTTEKNLLDLLPLVNDFTVSRLCIVSDDKHPDDLLEEGHLNSSVYLAVKNGISAVHAIRMASLNASLYYNLRFRGAIAPGYLADFQFLSDLEKGLLKPLAVFKEGKLVAEDGNLTVSFDAPSVPIDATKTVRLERTILEEDLKLHKEGERARIIKVVPGQIVTEMEVLPIKGNTFVEPDTERDILKMAVIERYTGLGNLALGLVKGFGLKAGAIACSVAHDSHNLISVGTSDRDLAFALNEVVRLNGGLVAVKSERLLGALPLPLAGLMSLEGAEEVTQKLSVLLENVQRELACVLENPFMTLSFLALPVIPKLKLTDKGLIDVDKFDFVPLFVD